MSEYKIQIENKAKGIKYTPQIEGEVTITWARSLEAGVLTFNVVKDKVIDYQEGNPVALFKDGELIFYGYVFKKSRSGKQIIKTTCYDQLRYFKYKDTYQYEDKTYSELLQMLCEDRHLTIGDIEPTKYKIPARVERDKEFFSIIKTASDLTVAHEGKEYILFDEKGKICLRSWEKMKVNEVLTYNNTQDFEYMTTIDNAYNRIKVNYIDDETKEVTPYITEDPKNINNWGILQYYAETSNKENIKEKSGMLLELLNRKERSLDIKGTRGNWNVRGGSLVPVVFENIGDISVNSMMLVDKVTHKIKNGHHFMDLKVFNKDIQPAWTGQGTFEPPKEKQKEAQANTGTGYAGADNEKLNKMISYALSKTGAKYSQPKRMQEGYYDCSSLVQRAMEYAGLGGQHLTSRSIHSDSRFYPISMNEIKPGDVLWTNNPSGHVAIYIGNNKTIEATTSGVKSIVVKGRNHPFKKAYRPKGA